MPKLGFDTAKILTYSKNSLFPLLVIGIFFVYFSSVSGFSEESYHSIHMFFLGTATLAIMLPLFLKIPSITMSSFVILVGYLIINSMRYTYGEDYMFSSGYNVWCMMIFPNLLLAYACFPYNRPYKYWSWFYIFVLVQTAIIERLQNQNIDADSYYFYKHIGMFNYPALCIAAFCLISLIIHQIVKGRILGAANLISAIGVFTGILLSNDLYAFSLFFLSAALINLISAIYYAYYTAYKDEELGISNVKAFTMDAEKKYPLKYSVALMYIDEYDRLVKRFGAAKIKLLKKMFLARIHKVRPSVLIYNYKADALILVFKNINAAEGFDIAEEIRRTIAKSIFIFDENNRVQLTVSQCISEFRRSDAGAMGVLRRAEENLKKACKFTRNITVKA